MSTPSGALLVMAVLHPVAGDRAGLALGGRTPQRAALRPIVLGVGIAAAIAHAYLQSGDALVYLLVNVMLLGVQTSFTPTVHWPLFPALGWGIGLAFHGMAVFLAAPGAALRERMVAEELRNLEARRDAARQR